MAEFDSTYVQPWTGSAILLVDLDAFFASVEQLDHPAWRGKPVIVGGDADKHGVVSTASYEARAYGVHSAMAASAARELCPQAIWTHGHFDRYKEMSARVMAILHDESPHVQQVSIDEAFVDVSPTEVNSEHPVAIAGRIQKRVAHLGVTCSIGVGTSKTVAKIASDQDKPRGLTVIYPGSELDFLFPLPIRVMSGVGKRAEEELLRHGIRTLGDMAEASEDVLRSIYGKNSEMMRMRCLGVDATAVKQDETVKSVSNEMTFSQDLVTFDAIENAANMLAAKVARRLRKNGLKGSTLALKLRFADRTSKSCQTQLRAQDDNEHVFMPEIRRMLSQIWKPGMRVRLVGVAVSHFEKDEVVQESLFDTAPFDTAPFDASPQDEQGAAKKPSIDAEVGRSLSKATDKVKDRFGEGAVFFGRDLRFKDKTTGTAAKNPADYSR